MIRAADSFSASYARRNNNLQSWLSENLKYHKMIFTSHSTLQLAAETAPLNDTRNISVCSDANAEGSNHVPDEVVCEVAENDDKVSRHRHYSRINK
jgi:hypothetical protein